MDSLTVSVCEEPGVAEFGGSLSGLTGCKALAGAAVIGGLSWEDPLPSLLLWPSAGGISSSRGSCFLQSRGSGEHRSHKLLVA